MVRHAYKTHGPRSDCRTTGTGLGHGEGGVLVAMFHVRIPYIHFMRVCCVRSLVRSRLTCEYEYGRSYIDI